MKKILALACLLPLLAGAQNHEEACRVFYNISQLIKEEHFKPKPTDDSLSVYVFNTVIKNLDENRMILLKEDIDSLSRHKYKIDDYLISQDCAFFHDFISIYRNALQRNMDVIHEISSEGIDLNGSDTIYYSTSPFPYRKDIEAIKKFVRKKIVYDVLEDISKLSRNKDSLMNKFGELEKLSKVKITDTYLCRADALLNPEEGFENSIYHMFYAVFCSYFDPHSTYFNYNEKANFLSNISSENYSLGIYVSQNEKEEIIVEEIVPGGPAYKTQIDKGDQIIKLASENREYAVTCASMETITNIVFSDAYKTVELTLRKNDGTVYSVALEKKIMRAEDNSVYSFVINGEVPMGYLKIPSFYTEMDNKSIKGCADDVAKEIEKLKEENIHGLIIDLQFNGGGSMEEVIKMAGMFIDFGPLSVVVDKNGSRQVLKDYHRGNIYDGPMVVLVNGFSASASEFFSGIMQDYNRAIIVGSRTMGKASMQTIYQMEEENPSNFVKLTIDKFYRVTGKSSQYIGILPDIELPSYLDDLLPRENTLPTAMENDSIETRIRFKKLSQPFLSVIAANSAARIKNSPDFTEVQEVNKKVMEIYNTEKAPVALNFDSVFNDVHSMDNIWKSISNAEEKEQGLRIKTPNDTYQKIMYDDFLSNTNEYRLKLVKTSPHVKESFNILNDLYNSENNK